MINMYDFDGWHPRQLMAGETGENLVQLWCELDFETETYTYIVHVFNKEEDFIFDQLWEAVDKYNEEVKHKEHR